MPRIFISYRRADSRKDAGRLYDRLVHAFGKENVFKDVNNISPGSDFRDVITRAIEQCNVLLVLIGSEWLSVLDDDGQRRLDNPDDFVRIEIETGLQSKCQRIIPVLLDGAEMPEIEDLPTSLRELASKNASVIRDDPDFDHDVERLIASFGQGTGELTPPTLRSQIEQFYAASDAKQWEQARSILADIRTANNVPRFFDLEQAEKTVRTNIERADAERDYDILRIMSLRETPDRLWAALQIFWENHPGYDPDHLAQRCRPARVTQTSFAPAFILPPPFTWIEIPEGAVSLDNATDQNPPGTIGGRYTIPGFVIAKYPITNAQYQIFVEAEDGYRDPRWWEFSSEAMLWFSSHPQSDRSMFAGDDLPRTNVCWYEAVGFCRWLSYKSGQDITLPTEQQWQRAAQGDNAQFYPWGRDFDRSKCNFDAPGPTSVTQFPNGASPYGALDMSGNVWEWCLTEWGTDSTILAGDRLRVLRGGSAGNHDPALLRVTYRHWEDPTAENRFIGFRVARSL
jgi:formylglycine-generating enzyme required for sulfatase activity